jgi:hypothetical protein
MKLTFKKMTALPTLLLGGGIVDGDGCSAVRSRPCR